MKRILCVFATLIMDLLYRGLAFAADVTGTWTGDMVTPDGSSFHILFTFKQDGRKADRHGFGA